MTQYLHGNIPAKSIYIPYNYFIYIWLKKLKLWLPLILHLYRMPFVGKNGIIEQVYIVISVFGDSVDNKSKPTNSSPIVQKFVYMGVLLYSPVPIISRFHLSFFFFALDILHSDHSSHISRPSFPCSLITSILPLARIE